MKYGLIGKPLGHSYSREIHRLIADYDYELKELDENEVAPFCQNANSTQSTSRYPTNKP